MPGLRSLRNRLAVIFALIIIGAIGTIYLSVTPRLEASLTSQRLSQVIASSLQYTATLADYFLPAKEMYAPEKIPRLKSGPVDDAQVRRDSAAKVRKFAERTGTEVLVMSDGGPAGPVLITDATPDGAAASRDVQDVTREALRTRRQASAVVTTANGRMALAAKPIQDKRVKGKKYVAVFADSLSDVQDNVELIRRQVLISGGIALVIAILAGYLVAARPGAGGKR